MTVLLFEKRFSELVRSGAKSRTIRALGKREYHVGQRLSLRIWEGRPYRSKQVELKRVTVGAIRDIRIDSVWAMPQVVVDGDRLGDHCLHRLAVADGFSGIATFQDYFARVHGFPFHGRIIEWAGDVGDWELGMGGKTWDTR